MNSRGPWLAIWGLCVAFIVAYAYVLSTRKPCECGPTAPVCECKAVKGCECKPTVAKCRACGEHCSCCSCEKPKPPSAKKAAVSVVTKQPACTDCRPARRGLRR